MATILVLESNTIVRNFVMTVLSGDGHKVFEAGHGLDAFRISDSFEGKIDLLVIGGQLPDVSAAEATRYIAHARPDVRIVHMLSWPPGSLSRGHDPESPSGYLEKPFSRNELLRQVQAALGENSGNANRVSSPAERARRRGAESA
jgi:DNA-binding response OmpR family regulator